MEVVGTLLIAPDDAAAGDENELPVGKSDPVGIKDGTAAVGQRCRAAIIQITVEIIQTVGNGVAIDNAVVQGGIIDATTAVASRVASQSAVVQRAIARPAASIGSRVVCNDTVIQHRGIRTTTSVCCRIPYKDAIV